MAQGVFPMAHTSITVEPTSKLIKNLAIFQFLARILQHIVYVTCGWGGATGSSFLGSSGIPTLVTLIAVVRGCEIFDCVSCDEGGCEDCDRGGVWCVGAGCWCDIDCSGTYCSWTCDVILVLVVSSLLKPWVESNDGPSVGFEPNRINHKYMCDPIWSQFVQEANKIWYPGSPVNALLRYQIQLQNGRLAVFKHFSCATSVVFTKLGHTFVNVSVFDKIIYYFSGINFQSKAFHLMLAIHSFYKR